MKLVVGIETKHSQKIIHNDYKFSGDKSDKGGTVKAAGVSRQVISKITNRWSKRKVNGNSLASRGL